MSAQNNRSEPAGSPGSKFSMRTAVTRRFIQVAIQQGIQAAVLFGCAGTLRWPAAWIFTGYNFFLILINGFLMLKYNPGVIARRGEQQKNAKAWDNLLGGLYASLHMLAALAIAGLDVRFGWLPDLPVGLHAVGLVIYTLGMTLFSLSMVSNAFFSTKVRIQLDSGHTVSTGGPYRYVRHPGYAGGIILSLGTPLALGSLWALLPEILAIAALIVRTAFEDRALLEELPGYKAYAEQVRYRLIPGIW